MLIADDTTSLSAMQLSDETRAIFGLTSVEDIYTLLGRQDTPVSAKSTHAPPEVIDMTADHWEECAVQRGIQWYVAKHFSDSQHPVRAQQFHRSLAKGKQKYLLSMLDADKKPDATTRTLKGAAQTTLQSLRPHQHLRSLSTSPVPPVFRRISSMTSSTKPVEDANHLKQPPALTRPATSTTSVNVALKASTFIGKIKRQQEIRQQQIHKLIDDAKQSDFLIMRAILESEDDKLQASVAGNRSQQLPHHGILLDESVMAQIVDHKLTQQRQQYKSGGGRSRSEVREMLKGTRNFSFHGRSNCADYLYTEDVAGQQLLGTMQRGLIDGRLGEGSDAQNGIEMYHKHKRCDALLGKMSSRVGRVYATADAQKFYESIVQARNITDACVGTHTPAYEVIDKHVKSVTVDGKSQRKIPGMRRSRVADFYEKT